MALTQVSSKGIKDATLLNEDVNASADIAGSKLADNSISLAKLLHGDSNNNGKFLRANNGADPSFEAIDLSSKFSKAGGDTITGDFTIASGTTNKNINIDVSDRIRFDDNLQATFGNSDDLKIYHASNDNYLDLNSGTLKIRLTSGADFIELQQDRDVWIKGEPKPWDNNTYSLGRSDYKWSAVHATTYYGDGSNLTGISGVSVAGQANDRIITATGTTDALQGESNLTFNGNQLLTVSTDSSTYATLNLDGNSGGLIQFEDNDTLIWEIYTNNAEFTIYDRTVTAYHTKFKAGGNLEIENGNLKFNGSGHGIDFSVDSNASGMTSELLDDYEEGSFTIVAGSGSSVTFNSNNNTASYVKIGRQVTIAGQLRINSGNGNVRIALPFNAASSTDDEDMNFCCAVIGYDYNAQNGSDCDGLFLLIDHGLSYARFMEHRDNNPWTSLDGDPGAYLRFTLTYFVA